MCAKSSCMTQCGDEDASSGQQEAMQSYILAGESAQHRSRHAADGASAQAGADIAYGLTASEHQGKDRRFVAVTSARRPLAELPFHALLTLLATTTLLLAMLFQLAVLWCTAVRQQLQHANGWRRPPRRRRLPKRQRMLHAMSAANTPLVASQQRSAYGCNLTRLQLGVDWLNVNLDIKTSHQHVRFLDCTVSSRSAALTTPPVISCVLVPYCTGEGGAAGGDDGQCERARRQPLAAPQAGGWQRRSCPRCWPQQLGSTGMATCCRTLSICQATACDAWSASCMLSGARRLCSHDVHCVVNYAACLVAEAEGTGQPRHHSESAAFMSKAQKEMYGTAGDTGTLEDRVTRRKYYIDRKPDDSNAFRRG